MKKYRMVEEALTDPELGSYTTYGIRAEGPLEDDSDVQISDVSLSKQVVEELVERCNRLELDPIHLRDVVEDTVQLSGG